jgi:hypothetical protein
VAREERSVSLPTDLARSIEAAATAEGTIFSEPVRAIAHAAGTRLRIESV